MTSVAVLAPLECPIENENKAAWWSDVSVDNRVPSTTIPAEHSPWSGAGTPAAEWTEVNENKGSLSEEFLSPETRQWNDEHRGVKYSSTNDFALKKEIYRGRLSQVWYAVCAATGQEIVVKAYPKMYLRDRHLLNVRKEIAFLTKFDNEGYQGIVPLLGVFEDSENVYIVTEYCHGQDLLHQMDKSGGRMSEQDVCRKVVYPLLKIMDRLHKQGIVHRDLKAENVFFSKDDSLKLGDFGLALDLSCEVATTKVGTLDYMAPEVLRTPSPDELEKQNITIDKSGYYNEKVDIWSLGILAYELMVGKPPFEVEDMQQTMRLILWSPVENFPQSMSVFCQHFINKALEKDSSDRPSAEKLLQHPWICQNVGIRALAPPPGTATPRYEQITSKQQRGFSAPPSTHPVSAKSREKNSSEPTASPRKPSNNSKKCESARLEKPQNMNTSKCETSEGKSTLWSITDGPAKVYGVEPSVSKDSKRSGRFNPRKLAKPGRLLPNLFRRDSGESEHTKLCQDSPFSGKSVKDRLRHLLHKKLRLKKNSS